VLQVFANALRIKELRERILFTLAMVVVYRLGTIVPTPGVDPDAVARLFQGQGGVMEFLNLFSGGALERFSVFALGIAPYINSSIIMQLLVYVIPQLEKLQKEEGEEGRRTINRYTRYGTIVIAIIQGIGISLWLEANQVVLNPGWAFRLETVLTLAAGSSFVMWLGEQMTAKGIGNGISILITASIISSLPAALAQTYQVLNLSEPTPSSILQLIFLVVCVFTLTASVCVVQDGIRKVPVQHARRVVGRRVMGGANTHVPLRVNQAGVIPIIFANSVLMFPGLVLSWVKSQPMVAENEFWSRHLENILFVIQPGEWLYLILYGGLIVFFTYFYTAIQLNPKEMADNLKKYGGFVPGVRAGRKTADYLDRILNRITFAGALFLAAISLLPFLFFKVTNLNIFFSFGGTALLIVVGVALDTVRQVEAHMVTHHYKPIMRGA
jgi:preprotein translocase subunit SecY